MSHAQPQRTARRSSRYIIAPAFQLKYALLLVGIAVALLLGLGLVIAHSAKVAAEEARGSVTQAENALREAQTSARILALNSITDDDHSQEALAEIDRRNAAELARVRNRSAVIEESGPRIIVRLVAVGTCIALILAATGIYVTKKVVAPVVRLKRLLRKVGTGRLVVQEKLDRGDELSDLVDTFLQMTHSLRALQSDWIASIDEVLDKERALGAREEVSAGLQTLREQLSRGLRASDPPRAPGPRVTSPHPLLEIALQSLCARFEAMDYGVTPIIDLATLVAEADGKIDEREVSVLRYLFQESLGTRLSPEMVSHLIKSSLKAVEASDRRARAQLVTEILLDCDAVEEGLTIALAVAFASEGLSAPESALISSIAQGTGTPSARLAELTEQVRAWDINAMVAASGQAPPPG